VIPAGGEGLIDGGGDLCALGQSDEVALSRRIGGITGGIDHSGPGGSAAGRMAAGYRAGLVGARRCGQEAEHRGRKR